MILRAAHFYQDNRQRHLAKLHRVDMRQDRVQLMIDVFKKVYAIKLDEVQFALLQTLVLFSPDREGLMQSYEVERVQGRVTQALQQYCIVKLSNDGQMQFEGATVIFGRLMEILTDLRVLKVTPRLRRELRSTS